MVREVQTDELLSLLEVECTAESCWHIALLLKDASLKFSGLYSQPRNYNLTVAVINLSLLQKYLVDIVIEFYSSLIGFYIFCMLDLHESFAQILVFFVLLTLVFMEEGGIFPHICEFGVECFEDFAVLGIIAENAFYAKIKHHV